MAKMRNLAAAALSIAAMPQSTPQANIKTNMGRVEVSSKTYRKRKTLKQRREIDLDGFGGIQHSPFFSGTPPKQYGQYLQRAGLQKWTKKSK